jgi:imidazolonepropionase-like amidohydrolase
MHQVTRTTVQAGAFLLALSAAVLWPSTSPAADTFAFTGVSVIPMDSERVLEDRTVLVVDGRISAVGSARDMKLPDNARLVNGSGRFLMPGLAEMHAHVPGGSGDDGWLADVLFLYVANGVTTARGMLGQPPHLELRRRIEAGEVLGPRLFTSGPSVNGNSVSSPRQGARMVVGQAADGYDFIKLHPGLTLAEYEAVVEAALESGIPFAGHVSEAVGLDRALAARQATIDHLDGYMQALVPPGTAPPPSPGFFGAALVDLVDPDLIPAVATATREAGVWNVPTQTLIENIALPEPVATLAARDGMQYVPKGTLEGWKRRKQRVLDDPGYDPDQGRTFVDIRRRLILQLHQQGAGLLLGSDAPQVFNVPGFSIHFELDALVDAGLTPYEALYTGTAAPATFFGADGRFGTVVAGADADLILLDDNPLEDVSTLRKPLGVMVRGRWLSRQALDERLETIASKYRD